jgi:1,4-alpha-glucan branching enzyme
MKKNIVWYEINPNYFEQIALLKGIVSTAKQLSFFELVRRDLVRIQNLGCTGIWLMPLYVRGQEKKKGFGSPYAVKDYQISHLWGTDEELCKLVEEAHSMNMSPIIWLLMPLL